MFVRHENVKSLRKAKRCDGCETMIAVGQPAFRWTGTIDGLQTANFHPVCRKAEVGLNRVHRTQDGEWLGLQDMEWEDWPWLLERHPDVAVLMGITHTRYEVEKTESEELRLLSRDHDKAVRQRMDALIAEAKKQSGRHDAHV